MKDPQTYIDSGVLELFVTGNLPEAEAIAVSQEVSQSEILTREVEKIETALMHIARAAAPQTVPAFNHSTYVKESGSSKVIPLSPKAGISTYIGWAAAILLLCGVGYFYLENQELEQKLVDTQRDIDLQDGKLQVVEENLDKTTGILSAIRGTNVIKVPLGAQDIAPEAYAQVFWDKENGKAYIDVKGLPQPPEGKVYQVWSLTLEPLTPTSLGILDNYDSSSVQIFELDNANASEAFGITLEPEGGSESPTLEQLYTLGVVTS